MVFSICAAFVTGLVDSLGLDFDGIAAIPASLRSVQYAGSNFLVIVLGDPKISIEMINKINGKP